jgi:hypothetical protein
VTSLERSDSSCSSSCSWLLVSSSFSGKGNMSNSEKETAKTHHFPFLTCVSLSSLSTQSFQDSIQAFSICIVIQLLSSLLPFLCDSRCFCPEFSHSLSGRVLL